MTTTAKNKNLNKITFSPSVNIIRDAEVGLNYIPTPNAKLAFNKIINDSKTGIRSFSIVGAYGIGKSAFLWAFEKTHIEEKQYFGRSTSFGNIKYKFIKLVGTYTSFKQAFTKEIGLSKKDFSTNDILIQLARLYDSQKKKGTGLVIVVDEFGKFLEYAAKNNPESELYFIQELAEFVNDTRRQLLFIMSLHQDFNGYSRGLTNVQQSEWDKVKGRIKEVTFNEPVEQLLFLASERLSQLNIKPSNDNLQKLFRIIEKAKAFPLRDYFDKNFADKLLPFDILAASTLTLSLQKYGQNERSLFSFLEGNDHWAISDYNNKEELFNLASVYDYLIYTFHSFLTTKFNPHYAQWSAIRTAIERVEGVLTEDTTDAIKIVKAIGLINIFSLASAKIDREFLTGYSKYAMSVSAPQKVLNLLEKHKIILYKNYSNRYNLFEGTDLDIELAIDEAGNVVERITNVVFHLNKHFDFPYLTAKAATYKSGTPRFFGFYLSDKPEQLVPEGEIDGFVNLIFSDSVTEKNVKEFSRLNNEAVLYGLFKNTEEIKNLLFEIQKIEKVKETNADDRVAIRELNNILYAQIIFFNQYF